MRWKRRGEGGRVGDVELEGKVVLGGCVLEGEGGGIAGGSYDGIAGINHFLDVVLAEPALMISTAGE